MPEVDFVYAVGTKLYRNGQLFRFLGVNRYNLLTFDLLGCGTAWTTAELDTWFAEIDTIGIKAVRGWAFQDNFYSGTTPDWTRLDYVIGLCRQYDMYLILPLENQWAACSQGGYKYDTWYSTDYASPYGSYSLSYPQFVTAIVTRYKDEPRILMWQLMNEGECKDLTNTEQPATLATFAANMTAYIRAIDYKHLITLGTMGAGQPGVAGSDYATVHSAANIGILEMHDYNDETTAYPTDLVDRVDDMRELNKPLFIGEAGITLDEYSAADRNTYFTAKINAAFDNGVSGYVIWSYHDNGGGATEYSFNQADPLATTLTNLSGEMAMTIAFDAASTASAFSNTVSWSHTVSGNNPILLVFTSIDANATVTACTYGGKSLVNVGTAGTDTSVELWYMPNPTVGTATVAITWSASDSIAAAAASYNNVDPNTPIGAAVTGADTGTTASVAVTAAVGDLVVDAVAVNNIAQDGLAVGASQTQRAQINRGGASGVVLGASDENGAASVTMSWTWTGSQRWAMVAVPLRPVQVNKVYSPACRTTDVYNPAYRVTDVRNPAVRS